MKKLINELVKLNWEELVDEIGRAHGRGEEVMSVLRTMSQDERLNHSQRQAVWFMMNEVNKDS